MGRKKIFTLAYVDDVIPLANNETGMKKMIKRFRKYIEKRLRAECKKIKNDGI